MSFSDCEADDPVGGVSLGRAPEAAQGREVDEGKRRRLVVEDSDEDVEELPSPPKLLIGTPSSSVQAPIGKAKTPQSETSSASNNNGSQSDEDDSGDDDDEEEVGKDENQLDDDDDFVKVEPTKPMKKTPSVPTAAKSKATAATMPSATSDPRFDFPTASLLGDLKLPAGPAGQVGQYMLDINRPVNASQIVQKFKDKLTKVAIEKAITQLVGKDILIKEASSNIYWVNQTLLAGDDDAKELDAQIAVSTDKIQRLVQFYLSGVHHNR